VNAPDDADDLGKDTIVQPIRELRNSYATEGGADLRESFRSRGDGFNGRVDRCHQSTGCIRAALMVPREGFRNLRIRHGAEADDAH